MVREERVIGGKLVGKEEGAVNGILWRRIESIEGEDDGDDDERVRPGVSEGKVFPAAEVGAGFSPFGM